MTDAPAAWADRTWESLEQRYLHSRPDGRVLVRRGFLRADAWTVSQIAAAAVVRAAVHGGTWQTADGLFRGLDDHLFRDAGYTGAHRRSLGPRELYYDDNAWIGLACVASGLVRARSGPVHLAEVERDLWRARMILRLLQVGEHPDGGVMWRVGGDTRNACSTGPAGILAVRVVELERRLGIAAADHRQLLAFGQRCAAFLARLVDGTGMVADHMRADGSVDRPVYAYNQGTAIGLQVQLARAATGWSGASDAGPRSSSLPDDASAEAGGTTAETDGWSAVGDADRSGLGLHREHMAKARSLAQAAWDAYAPGGSGTRLWRDCPVFVAILCRNLLALWAEDGDERWPAMIDTWREAMEVTALVPRTGDYTRNGVGHYGTARALDRAGVCSVHWARRWPQELLPLLT